MLYEHILRHIYMYIHTHLCLPAYANAGLCSAVLHPFFFSNGTHSYVPNQQGYRMTQQTARIWAMGRWGHVPLPLTNDPVFLQQPAPNADHPSSCSSRTHSGFGLSWPCDLQGSCDLSMTGFVFSTHSKRPLLLSGKRWLKGQWGFWMLNAI